MALQTGSQKAKAGQLPAPTLKLMHANNTVGQDPVFIPYMDAGYNYAGDYKLWRFPQITATDLTQEQIDKGVYVEMAHYRKVKHRYNRDKGGGFVVPADNSTNPFINTHYRAGKAYKTDGTLMPYTYNHFRVSTINETVPVHKYLENRHMSYPVLYHDVTNNQQMINCLLKTGRIRNDYYPGKTFMYSGRYTPYYFKFRYVMLDDNGQPTISGPWTDVVKLAHREHPFTPDPVASATFGRQVGKINPSYDMGHMQCWIGTRLP